MSKDLFPEYVILILTIAFMVASTIYINNLFDRYNTLDCTSEYCYEVK